MNLGQVLRALGDVAGARAAYQAVVALDAGSVTGAPRPGPRSVRRRAISTLPPALPGSVANRPKLRGGLEQPRHLASGTR